MSQLNTLTHVPLKSSESTVIDHQLLSRVAVGDRHAFEELFRVYHPRVYKFAIGLLKDHELAQEVTGDTLFAVWQGAAKFQGKSAVSTWIFGIAYRRAAKTFKKDLRHSKNIEPEVDLDTLTMLEPGGNPELYANTEMESSQMLAALESLKADHRAVLELLSTGHSCAEIAEIVGCPENTVKTRTFHARRKIYAYFERINNVTK